MLGINMISWWYSRGWGIFVHKIFERLGGTVDFFSFSTIFKTLFAPFKQFSTMENGGSRISIAFDKLFSRLMGFIVRLGILIVGVIVLALQLVLSLVLLLIWPVLPMAPFVGIVLTVVGVMI